MDNTSIIMYSLTSVAIEELDFHMYALQQMFKSLVLETQIPMLKW